MTDLMARPNDCSADCPVVYDLHPMQHVEPGTSERLNRLRAAVLGANDGIVSTAAVIVGVAGATANQTTIAMSGLAAVVGGAVSMALGEYVSVSSQRDSERSMGFAEHQQVNPWSAGIASFLSFILGAVLPFVTAILAPESVRIVSIFAVTLVALALTGALSAKLGDSPVLRPVLRIVVGGTLGLAMTFAVGSLFGAAAL